MFTVRLCDLNIELDNRYGYVEALCRDYIVRDGTPAFRVSVSHREVECYRSECARPMTAPEAESVLLYRAICGQLPAFDALLLHAAVLCVDGRGYAFSAPRGVGKTTHLRAWQSALGERVTVINGDKPLLRRSPEGHWQVFGTPWCGKEGEQSNRSCPLDAICFLSRGTENAITPASETDAAVGLLAATALPPTEPLRERMADLVGMLVREVPTFRLACLPDRTAAELAYATLSRGGRL